MAIRRWRHGLGVYWRSPGESQIGVDPRLAVVLDGLDAAEQQLLERLPGAGGEPELSGWANRRGIAPSTVARLLRRVRSAGALVDAAPGSAGPDERYWSLAQLTGLDRPADRGARAVAVRGADELGLRVAVVLARAGVGRVVVEDDEAVTALDVAPGGYERADVGRSRRDAAAAVLRRASPTVGVTAGRDGVGLTVVVGHGTTDPAAVRDLWAADAAHLPVVVRELDVVVGPLVRPGRGPCVRCLDLHRADADPRWPAVATQLVTRPPRGAETSLAWLGAALAAHQVLAVVDGRASLVEAGTLEVTATYPVPRRRAWAVHPRCGCTAAALVGEAVIVPPTGVGT